MNLLREWAQRAHDMGFQGSLIRQIIADEEFESHALDGVIKATTSLREATTSDFPGLVGDSSNVERDMIKSWDIAKSNWKKLVQTVPLRDMKTVTRLRRSDTDRYIVVPEGAEHEQGDFSSYTVTYTPKSYELGLAAGNTLSDFVIGFLKNNPTIYDSVALFHANHGNLGLAALDETSLSAGVTAMRS